MTTTLQILSKTPTSISLRGAKDQTNSMAIAVGPGNDYETIWANAAASQAVGSGQTGSFDVTFSSGLASNTQYGAVAFLFGGGAGEVSSVLDGTLPSPALSSVSVNKLSSDYVEINFSMVADGGYYSRNVQYSLDNGSTWTTGYTASGGSAVSGQIITPFNLVANTAYTMQTRVSTTAGNTTSPSVSFTTLSAEPTITQESATDSSVLMRFSFAADGGAYDKTIVYTIDGGVNWITAGTVTGGGAVFGTFEIENLQPNTSYNLIVRVTTGAGTITLDDMTITTGGIASDHHLVYAPLKFLDDMQGYTIEPIGSSPAAIESVNMPQFVTWVKGVSQWARELNNGVDIERFDVYVYKTLSIYTFQVALIGKDGAIHNWRAFTENSASALAATALASTGVTISTAGLPSIEKSSIVPTTVEYRYEAKTVSSFYGPVNGGATKATKMYGPAEVDVVSGVTGTIRTGGIGNVTAFDATTFWDSQGSHVDKNKVPVYLYFTADSTQGARGLVLERIRYLDGTYRNLRTASMASFVTVKTAFARDGITLASMTDGVDYIDLTPLYSKESQTKLIHQEFGHLNYT